MIAVHLIEALYGCIQSAKLWFSTIKNMLLNLDFVQNLQDACVFNQGQTTIGLYVDDLIITAQEEGAINSLLQQLVKHFKRIEVNRGTCHDYLGMRLLFCHEDRSVKISMSGYIQSLISDNNIRRTSSFPAVPDILKMSQQDEVLLSPAMQQSLHSTVARIQYLASRSRPDIQFVTSHLASRVNKFVASDQTKVTKLLEYLAGTIEKGITLHIPDTSSISMKLYADASFAIHQLSRSHSGGCLSLGSGSIAWKSKKQTLTTISTSESELVALSDMSALLFHMEKFLTIVGMTSSFLHI